MAKFRMVNTRFWDDNYIVELNSEEKLLFLYLITNSLTDICGIYEVSTKRIAYDTGIDSLSIQKILDKFQKDNKIKYVNGWICIKNFQRHQRTKSRKIKAGIRRSLSQIPEEVKNGIDSLSIGFDKPEPEPKPKPKPILKPILKPEEILRSEQNSQIKKVFEVFYKINPTINWGNKTSRKAAADLIAKFTLEGTLKMAEQIVAVQGKKYAPTCTTPYQMKEKLAEFKIYFDKEGSKKLDYVKI